VGNTSVVSYLQERVSNTTFDGIVVLVIQDSNININDSSMVLSPWNKAPVGIHNNMLVSNCILSTSSWISNNTLLSDTHILSSAVVVSCGSITATASTKDNEIWTQNDAKLNLSVGPESGGGRKLSLSPECDMKQVCQQLTNYQNHHQIPSLTISQNSSNMNIISSHCLVRNVPTIQNIYMAPQSALEGATSVTNTLLCSTASIANSSIVYNCRLQWKTSIKDNSHVSDTILMEEAHIGPQSLVASSVLGPDVHVSAGEVHCSVLGPNTNAHHQSLVISVLWPLGRGNVGYGGNIGSNHTGRIPDQETTSGEGVFWGLSCVVKFPVDLTMSPYSIVAAGTTVPPQRVCMPFSLIVTGNDNNHNNIIPGWVLSSSPYTVARSETKYSTRRKAQRHNHYTGWKIIRPETIAMCHWARKQLACVGGTESPTLTKTYATDKAIPGIGSNILSEKGRLAGIQAYSDCIQKFALHGLLMWLSTQETLVDASLEREFQAVPQVLAEFVNVDKLYNQVSWPEFPWQATMNERQMWEYQKQLLLDEFPRNGSSTAEWVIELLQTLVVLEKAYAAKIFKSKKRDDQRGAATIPGYERSHIAAEIDPVIKQANQDAEEVKLAVANLTRKLKSSFRSKL